MKIIAYYLPQYHRIKENDKWWGNGFTEWTNVKKAKKLYRKHYQPLEPLDNNYYDLLDRRTVEWQTSLLNKYGIDGLCYYHYWFNGKTILEKPAENLLKWRNIKQNFCFCWANHSWKKTWEGKNEILLNQEYGNIEDWAKHFEYLKRFFLDKRYIKKENKPIFVIFQPEHIKYLDEMIVFFSNECKKIGFSGIYVIESVMNLNNRKLVSINSSAKVTREPDLALKKRGIIKKILHKIKKSFSKNFLYFPQREKYKKIVEYSIKLAKENVTENFFPGIFTAWDNTARHGRRGYIIENSSPELFKEYLEEIKKIMIQKNSEYLFINAWNEWAEGMYLEPDKKYKYAYLEKIKEVFNE